MDARVSRSWTLVNTIFVIVDIYKINLKFYYLFWYAHKETVFIFCLRLLVPTKWIFKGFDARVWRGLQEVNTFFVTIDFCKYNLKSDYRFRCIFQEKLYYFFTYGYYFSQNKFLNILDALVSTSRLPVNTIFIIIRIKPKVRL